MMMKKLVLAFLTAGLAMSSTLALAAENAYMTIVGSKSGKINGGVTQKGREDSFEVMDVSHSILSPRDPQSGLPSGKRMHKPFVVLIPLDRGAPLLYNALNTNENLTDVTFDFWSSTLAGGGIGSESQTYTVKLANANISSIDFAEGDPAGAAASGKGRPSLRVSFTYQKITWTWKQGGITATDDWATH